MNIGHSLTQGPLPGRAMTSKEYNDWLDRNPGRVVNWAPRHQHNDRLVNLHHSVGLDGDYN